MQQIYATVTLVDRKGTAKLIFTRRSALTLYFSLMLLVHLGTFVRSIFILCGLLMVLLLPSTWKSGLPADMADQPAKQTNGKRCDRTHALHWRGSKGLFLLFLPPTLTTRKDNQCDRLHPLAKRRPLFHLPPYEGAAENYYCDYCRRHGL